ncbi:hypothetical protein F7734_51900 [Scytonema sp. UIC 10036]|uniref:hypothetical protein n=1 Tax=Scytonema sp. UIC 10036 TaxID=2304196 RepID=UPI0012DA9A6F|nr:hypothetical protein [Scytonema sp. UIC 10036]MUH00330.1 hypothetical protein [Scytonema sp. UIC 10036]
MHTPLHSAIQSVLYRHKHQPKSLQQLQTELSRLQHQVSRVVALQKECINLERATTQRIKSELERDRTSGEVAPQQQQQLEVQQMSVQDLYQLAQQPDKFSQFICVHEQELKSLAS